MEVSYALKTGGDIVVVDFNNHLDQIEKLLWWGSGDGSLDRGFAGKHEDQTSDPWDLVQWAWQSACDPMEVATGLTELGG